MTVEFSQLNLQPELMQAVSDLGYVTPTPIQAAVIPLMLAGQDVMGQAQTGTGKTAAFSLPILQNLEAGQRHVQILVLVPTRELALQVAKAMAEYGRHLDTQVLAVYGGQPYGHQIGRLKKGVDIVVGTPGRLLDLIDKKVLDLSSIRTVVLDEADEMLSMGFIEDIESILDKTPTERQTALFSATLPASVQRLAKRYLQAPQSISIQPEQPTVAAIEQRYYLVNEADKLAALTRLFEIETISSALIFVRTRAASGELANALTTRGFPAEALSGDLSQDMRERVMDRFRHDQIKVLVATDVAARGLDIEDISHVFNYDLPDDPELYVHRIGRTGRAGKTGIAISLVSPQQQWRLRRIEGFAKQKFTRASLPSVEDIQGYREAQLMNQVEVWLQRGRCRRERELVAELAEAGHDPLEIAAVALKIARAEEKQRPILPVSEVQEMRSRQKSGERGQKGRSNGRKESHVSHEIGMVRLSLSRGKAHGVRTSDVVSTIAYTADIPGSTIGKISIRDQYTLIDVPEKFVPQVLAKTGDYRIRRQPMTVKLA
jgi:ATP-dependent RNA helicase DeaD